MISFHSSQELPVDSQVILLPFFKEDIHHELISATAGIQRAVDFSGSWKECLTLYPPTKAHKVLLLGLGTKGNRNDTFQAFRSLVFHQYKKLAKDLHVELSHLPADMAYQAALGIELATYSIGIHKTATGDERIPESIVQRVQLVHSHSDINAFISKGQLTAETMCKMMHLVDSPANIKTPNYLAQYVKESAKRNKYRAEVFDKKALEEKGLHTILAVGKGSKDDPVMILMEYNGTESSTGKPKLGLAGKGITFDTGGISIKGSQNMHYMKSDMGGAAAVIGAIELAAKLKLPIHVVGIVPSAENAVDALSLKPGDVIPSYSGKTIEVIDTDAEGRLVLADGLAYMIKHFQPEILIDLATLTGSVVRSLGYAAAGLFTNNDGLAQQLEEVGNEVHERVWRMPLWKDYEDDLHSDIADVRNFSGKPIAGAIMAAKFLEVFTDDHPAWAHLDIAGVAFGDSEFSKMKSASAYGVRLLVNLMEQLS